MAVFKLHQHSGEYCCEAHTSSHYVLTVVESGDIAYDWSYGLVTECDLLYACESGNELDLSYHITSALVCE